LRNHTSDTHPLPLWQLALPKRRHNTSIAFIWPNDAEIGRLLLFGAVHRFYLGEYNPYHTYAQRSPCK